MSTKKRTVASDMLANHEFNGFKEALRLIHLQCDAERRLGGDSHQLHQLREAAAEASTIYTRHVEAAKRQAFEEMAASDDEDLQAIGQAALSGDWSSLAI
jgi:hypothetical protein